MRLARITAVLLTLATASTGLIAPARADERGVRFADGGGIHVVTVRRIDDRQYAVRVSTAALGRAVDVRILLPTGYERRASARYPVLYLFHGTSGRASDWVEAGDAEKTTAGRPLITVMPDAGFDGNGGGWFTDWADPGTSLGPSKWETFHVGQLIPWIDHNLRTVARREGRAIAGLSQGGFGAMSYASRHPALFVSAASFSGAPDIAYNPVVSLGATAVVSYIALALDGVSPDAIFGSRLTDGINWRGHDPAGLAPNLRGMRLALYTATGIPGPLDPPVPDPSAIGIEALTHASTISFHHRLDELKIPSRYTDYVLGTHIFPYWARDLRQHIGPLMRTFADPPRPPAKISYRSIDRHWSQWGWTVSLRRPRAQEFSTLSGASKTGFTLRAAGTATVTTPASYRPGAAVVVRAGHRVIRTTAGLDGRLTITLPRAHGVTTTRVSITTARGSVTTPR
ncbi:alpha/beta hydrolase [Actinomadura latina]|uniref:Esterase family protein n=1 Tax=Actinomadura latina TaxID=163603 RepID=A0A846YYE7_9ACTN|nr:alpha/beta hydrolase family protein [Actinomadura latina]NKZ03176.1 esterase family protein [Actinomadura latina]